MKEYESSYFRGPGERPSAAPDVTEIAALEVGVFCPPHDPSEADRTPISEIMTPYVVCVSPGLDLDALGSLFVEVGISGAPVMDDRGQMIGVVSKTDLIRALRTRSGSDGASLANGGVRVGDIMMPITFCLHRCEPVAKAAALMAFEGVHRVPVVDEDGHIVGVVCPLDVLRWLARQNGYRVDV
jgi:CBS-domain-containing membrane protein